MKEDLYQYLANQGGNMTVREIAICFAAALVISFVIFISYRISHATTVYSAKFNVSLVMLTVVTTLIMSVIGNNVALSLGMVGALSIVRFRTAVKDPRDTAYIFWCIAAGVCCGIQDFTVAAIGSGTVFFVMLLLGNIKSNDRYLVIIRGKNNTSEAIHNAVKSYFNNSAVLRVENTDHSCSELIYEVSQSAIKRYEKKNGNLSIRARLMEVVGVESVNLVCQNDEITR
ncbi:MAG: DUF4956 domain-containing protein [Lachnospiraceae bacterium]|jgi:hypothetical protein|nr:DUF4956 domain-containing protein [Lachnospiraceae bacterium]